MIVSGSHECLILDFVLFTCSIIILVFRGC